MPHKASDDARNILLNQFVKPYTAYALSDERMAAWELAFLVRGDVNGVLEKARNDKRIGKSLEAHVALQALDADAAAALKAIQDMNLAEIFIVSNAAVTGGAPAENAVVGSGAAFPGLTIAVTEATGTKCPRCWMHSLDAGEDGLCPRCAAVIRTLDVEF